MLGGKGHGFEVDIWNFGILIFEILTGTTPFSGDSPMQIFQKIRAGQFDLPSSIPSAVQDLIRKILVTDPHDRVTIA